MFIRKKKSPGSPRQTVQIVKNERIGGKTRQKTMAYIGVIQKQGDEEHIMALAKTKLLELIKQDGLERHHQIYTDDELKQLTRRGRRKLDLLKETPTVTEVGSIALNTLQEEYRLIDGLKDIGASALTALGLDHLLKTKKQNVLFQDLLFMRMGFSQSKLRLCDTMRNKLNRNYTEDQIYRLMDHLYPKIKTIKKRIFSHTQALMPSVNVLLFDVTTLYCESVIQDGLREFGFSKDGKFNNTQLVLALATNERGLPIGYEVFSGNCAEVHTLLAAIQKWHRFLPIKQICFIGDRAMFSEDNLRLLEAHGYDYIIAAKLRNQSQEIQEKILDESNYHSFSQAEEGRIAEFDIANPSPTIRCEVNHCSGFGYTMECRNQEVIRIIYKSPTGEQIEPSQEAFKAHKERLWRLKRYTKSTECILMNQSEYLLKSLGRQNDVLILCEGVELIFVSTAPQREHLSPLQLFLYFGPNQVLHYSTITPSGELVMDGMLPHQSEVIDRPAVTRLA